VFGAARKPNTHTLVVLLSLLAHDMFSPRSGGQRLCPFRRRQAKWLQGPKTDARCWPSHKTGQVIHRCVRLVSFLLIFILNWLTSQSVWVGPLSGKHKQTCFITSWSQYLFVAENHNKPLLSGFCCYWGKKVLLSLIALSVWDKQRKPLLFMDVHNIMYL